MLVHTILFLECINFIIFAIKIHLLFDFNTTHMNKTLYYSNFIAMAYVMQMKFYTIRGVMSHYSQSCVMNII
jgi:hypothetical protein